MRMGAKMRNCEGQQKECIFADSGYLFAASKEEIRKMIVDTTEEMTKKGLDWKEDQM